MRYVHFKLNEEGLSHGQISKDYGKYLDALIGLIANGDDIELDGVSKDKFGKKVKFQKSDAELLAKAYYGTDEIPDDKSELTVTGQRNNIVPPTNNYKKLRLTIDGSENTVPLGDVFKSQAIKGDKGFNVGDVGEAFLGAAVSAKFKKLGGEVSETDIINILQDLKIIEAGKNKKGEVIASMGNDTLEFKLTLNRTSFTAIEKAIATKKLPPAMVGLNRSAMTWVNKSETVTEAIKVITSDQGENQITVMSDGVLDQKGTKADLFLNLDGKTINLLSAKAGDVKQFGQDSGNTFDIFVKYFQNIFGVDIPNKWVDQLNDDIAKDNFPVLQKIYKDVYNEIENELKGNTKKEVIFLERLYKGISHHATRNDPKVSMVILKDTPNKPGYKELFFGPELQEAMKQFDLRVTLQENPPKIQVYGIPVGTDAKKEIKLTGNQLLIQARSNLKGDSAKGYIRNIIEMGGLLKTIAAVKQDVEQEKKQPEPKAPEPVAPKQPLNKEPQQDQVVSAEV